MEVPPAPAPSPAPAQARRSNSRSRRSHASFSDLRLAPLSVPEPKKAVEPLKSPGTPGFIDVGTAQAYRSNHSSYLAGRSAPSTPGILRSSSRRRQYGGLSRKAPSQDGEDDDEDAENMDPSYFTYDAIRTASHGGVLDISHGYLHDNLKSKSESRLYRGDGKSKGAKLLPLKTGHGQHKSADFRAKRRSHHSGLVTPTSGPRARVGRSGDHEDDWLSHATSYTTSLLAEGKGQSWVSSHSSTTNLHSYTSHVQSASRPYSAYHTSSDSDDALAASTATLKPRNKSKHRASARLSFIGTGLAYDEQDAPLRSPAVSAGWGSRFGSRAASRSNSRRGSRATLTKGLSGLSTPHDSTSAAYRFGSVAPMARSGDASADGGEDERDTPTPKVVPDFVDPSARAEIQASLASVARQQRLREAAQNAGGYFGNVRRTDDDEESHSSSDEAEVARLARTPGFGLGGFGILDRLVGMSNFKLEDTGDSEDLGAGGHHTEDDEDEEDGEQESTRTPTNATSAPVAKKSRGAMPNFSSWTRRDASNKDAEDPEAGGWRDAAWLLSVASKVLL